MTPKEKAEELVERFGRVIPFQDTYYSEEELYKMHKKNAKQCALICVDEIISIPSIQIAYIEEWSNNSKSKESYWREVKQEINKL